MLCYTSDYKSDYKRGRACGRQKRNTKKDSICSTRLMLCVVCFSFIDVSVIGLSVCVCVCVYLLNESGVCDLASSLCGVKTRLISYKFYPRFYCMRLVFLVFFLFITNKVYNVCSMFCVFACILCECVVFFDSFFLPLIQFMQFFYDYCNYLFHSSSSSFSFIIII